jgi:hypothetical protein
MGEHAAGATRQWFGGRPAVTTYAVLHGLCVAVPLWGQIGQSGTFCTWWRRCTGSLVVTSTEGLSLQALLSRRRRGFDLY